MQTQRIFSGTYREPIAWYARAVKKWNTIYISGTTADEENKIIGINDPAAQMRYIMQKIEKTLQKLDASMSDIIKTTIYIKNQEDCEQIVRIHWELFNWIEPANTTIQANLIGEKYLVEVEAVAIV